MKKYFYLFLLYFIGTATAFAQHPSCGTAHETNTERLTSLPYFADMAYLQALVDSVNNPAHRYSGDETAFQLPVKFWVYDDFSTTGVAGTPLEAFELEARLNEVNDEFARMGVSMFLYAHCDAPVLEDAEMATSNSDEIHRQRRGSTPHATTNKHWGAINFHFVENLADAANAVLPWNEGRYTVVSRYRGGNGWITWMHEIGHNLGLLHVHGAGLWVGQEM